MNFQTIKDRIRHIEAGYKAKMYTTKADYTEYAYRLTITKDTLSVTIRDGYFSDSDINSKPVQIASFDAFFTINDIRFAYYIFDYPLEEYVQRLDELEVLIDKFFAKQYSISDERFFLLWKKKYLKINDDDSPYFTQIKANSDSKP